MKSYNLKTNTQPTFLLKINPNTTYLKYKQGYFNRPIKTKKTIEIVKPIVKTSTLYQDVYLNTKVITTGAKHVELFTTNGHIMPVGGRCLSCLKDFNQEQIGYPVAYECKYLIDNHDTYKPIHVFWIEGCFHSYHCCLRYIRKINQGIVKDNLMLDAEIMLKLMYHLIYNTNEPLYEENDPLLLIEHGGSLTQEEYEDKNVSFVRTNTVIKIPAQVVYNRLT